MGCSPALLLLTSLLWIGTGLYVGGGISGLKGTMTLFTDYGPAEGHGNPALDGPPEMWINPTTGEWEPRNPNDPGNRVPKAFNIVQYMLIAWAVIAFATSIIFIVDSIRSRNAIQNRVYQGRKTSDSALSWTAWLTGYSVFLAVAWFIQAGFAVLPLLEYRITMQRCWDLENPNFAPSTKRAVCVDLVQYGLVLFRQTDDDGFALVCGPGGNYDPPRGDLEGFCEVYFPTFIAFVLCFAGAGVGLVAMMLFVLHHGTNFAYLKIRRYEGAPSRYYLGPGTTEKHSRQDRELSRTPSASVHLDYRGPPEPYAHRNGANLANPNYDSSIVESNRLQPKVPEVMSFRQYRPDEDDDMERHAMVSINGPNSKHLDSNNESYDAAGPRESAKLSEYSRSISPPSYNGESEENESRRSRSRRSNRKRRTGRHRRDRDSERSWRNSETADRRRRQRANDEEELSARYSSDDGHSRRSRRWASRDAPERRSESPSSDYYMGEDKQRRSGTRWG